MEDEDMIPRIPGHIRSEAAAEMLGITTNRLHQYARQGRLPSIPVGKSYLFKIEDVESFQKKPSGRARQKPTSWHTYKSGIKVFVTEIDVQVQAGQQQYLTEKLQTISNADRYVFPGTIARYVIQQDEQINSIHILLFWKGTDMPGAETLQAYLTAFQVELADVLDWKTAQIKTNETIIHT
jgi:excisionase family DNA binding protein